MGLKNSKEKRLTIDDLSEEIFDIIFSYLDPADIKTVRLVSRYWRHIIETPKFWTWAVGCGRDPQLVMESKIVRLVSVIKIYTVRIDCTPFLDKLSAGIISGDFPQLKTMKIYGTNLANAIKTTIKPTFLEAVVKLENCLLCSCSLTTEQLTFLFRAIQESTDLKLKTLNIDNLHFSIPSVEPGRLKASVLRLENCILWNCDLTIDQLTVLFRAIQESTDLRLKTLNVGSNLQISFVEPEILKAVVRLENCNLSNCDLTTEQSTDLFRDIEVSTDLKLKSLNIGKNSNISYVEPGLLQAVVGLENCNLQDCHLTTEQLTVLFRAIQESEDMKLKNLNISYLFTDIRKIRSVEPGLLQAVVKLETCNLYRCNLNTKQLTVLFKAIQESEDLKLRELDICGNNMSRVAPDILVEAVARLENCNLSHCLTTEQLTVLFRAIQKSEEFKLRVLDISSNNLSGVAPGILVEAVARLERVDLRKTDLTTNQLTGILRLVDGRRTLRCIDISGNDAITGVSASLRNKAENNQFVKLIT